MEAHQVETAAFLQRHFGQQLFQLDLAEIVIQPQPRLPQIKRHVVQCGVVGLFHPVGRAGGERSQRLIEIPFIGVQLQFRQQPRRAVGHQDVMDLAGLGLVVEPAGLHHHLFQIEGPAFKPL